MLRIIANTLTKLPTLLTHPHTNRIPKPVPFPTFSTTDPKNPHNNNPNANKPNSQSSFQPLSKEKLANKGGVFMNQQRIKAKMKEIKDREKDGASDSRDKKGKAKVDGEFMKNYQIGREMSAIAKFRKDTGTQNLMQVQDLTLDQKPTVLQVTSYSPQQIQIDSFQYPPCLILTPNQVLLWQLPSPKSLQVNHLKLIQLVNPPPTYVILASHNPLGVSEQVRNYLKSLNINYDISQVFEAVSNFNIYAVDEIQVMMFIDTRNED